MNYLRPDRLDALARDYVLGTMTGGARRRFERLLRGRPPALLAVGAWQARLDTLAATVPARTPRAAVWQSLERRLFAPSPTPAPWWRGWLSDRVLGGALAGVLAAVVVLHERPGWLGLEPAAETLPQSYVGLLVDGQGRPALLASARRHGRTLSVKMLQPLALAPGQAARLWALPRDGGAPFVVGAVPAQGSATIVLAADAEKLFFGVDRLGVSVEATPGTGTPGGDFVLTGHCVKLW